MPSYELVLLLKSMAKPELVTTLKRTAQEIFDRGGFIRRIDNLGLKPTPHKISVNQQVHHTANYFVFNFDAPPKVLDDLHEVCGRDVDIIRRRLYKDAEPEKFDCTIYEETLPPAYRKDVQEMIEIGKKKQKGRWQDNTGLPYYPFQR